MRQLEFLAIQRLFSNILEISPDEITQNLKYKEIPQWDSITHMFLIDEIERQFHIQIDPEDILEMSSVSKIMETLKKYEKTKH